jgi:DNA repair protein RadA/Sms
VDGRTRCASGHRFFDTNYRPGDNCPACALRGQYTRLVAETIDAPDVEALVLPVSQINLDAVPSLEIHGFLKLRAALNGIRRRTVYLTSGDPGVGKSTLLTQLALAHALDSPLAMTCYVAAEEPREAVAERSRRLFDLQQAQSQLYVFEGGDVGQLESVMGFETTPSFDLLIVDSIQTVWSPLLESPPGSVSQVIFCTNILKRLAREYDLTVWLLAHVTKDGLVAGPKSLEHLVDVVTQIEAGDGDFSRARTLTITKNRRGKLAGPVIFSVESNGAWRER